MSATPKSFPTTRTERQIQRLGIPVWMLTPAAVALFARRCRARLLVSWVLMVPAVAVVVALLYRQQLEDTRTAALDYYGFRTGLPIALFGLAVLVLAETRRRLDRRIAARLPTRVSRAERVPVLTVLGRVRAAYLIAAIVLDTALGGALFMPGHPYLYAYRWGFVVSLLCCIASTGLGVAREVRRPAIAVDPVSLTIDERMRSQEAFTAAAPLMILGNLAGYGVMPLENSGRWSDFFVAVPLLSLALWLIAQQFTPWPKPGPAPWLLQQARSMG